MSIVGSLPGQKQNLSGQEQSPLFAQGRTFVKAAVTSALVPETVMAAESTWCHFFIAPGRKMVVFQS
jgi:hypothetical protein